VCRRWLGTLRSALKKYNATLLSCLLARRSAWPGVCPPLPCLCLRSCCLYHRPTPPCPDLTCCRILDCADLRQLQASEGATSFLCAPVLLEAPALLAPEEGQRPAAAVLLVCYPSTAAAPQE
jgi:hypothetical protein